MTSDEISQLRQKYNSTLIYLHKAHSDLLILRVQPDFSLPTHLPGQYTTLGLGFWEPRHPDCQEEKIKPDYMTKLCRRSYSISSSILDESGRLIDRTGVSWLEFYITLVRRSPRPEGPGLTPRLFLLEEGDRLHLGEKITGAFTLEGVKPSDTLVFLSTGTGEAPHNFMLWQALRDGHRGRIVAACCVRYRRDLAYLAVQEELMRRFSNYTYLPLTTREGTSTERKVYIQDLITSGDLEKVIGKPMDPSSTHVYLCGNPAMIGAPEKDRNSGEIVYPKPTGVIEILEGRGFETDRPAIKLRGNIHFEKYW